MRHVVWSASLAIRVLLAPPALHSQAAGRCDAGQRPTSGGFDSSRTFCSVTRRALPTETTMATSLPHWMGYADFNATLVVGSYGAVDRGLTQNWSSAYGEFGVQGYNLKDSLFAALARFRFTPAFALDTAVRSALGIHLMTRGAPDSLPATASLRYVVGARGEDTLWLDWTPRPALPVGTASDIGAAIAAALAEFRMTPTDPPYYARDTTPWTGCSAVGPQIPEADAVRAWLRKGGVQLAAEGPCEPFETRYAVEWTRIFRITPRAYAIKYVAPGGIGGKCRVEQLDGKWMGQCR